MTDKRDEPTDPTKKVSKATPDTAGQAPVRLEAYAAICAELDAGVPIGEVLARESVNDETWAAAQAYWLRRMSDEAERKRYQVTTRYQGMFKAKRAVFEARLRREQAREGRAKVEAPPTRVIDHAARELSAPLLSSLPRLDLQDAPPATLQTPPAPHAMAAAYPAPSPFQAPAPLPPMPARSPSPMPSAAPVAFATTPAPPPMIARPVGSMAGPLTGPPTTAPAGSSVLPASTPFQAGKKSWATMIADSSEAFDRAPAVPFRKAPVQHAAPAPASPDAAPLTKPPAALAATTTFDLADLGIDALPFHGKGSPPKAAAPERKPPAAGAAPPPTRQHDDDEDLGRTGILDPETVARAVAMAMPFAARGAPPVLTNPDIPKPIVRQSHDMASAGDTQPTDDGAGPDSTRTRALPPENAASILSQTAPIDARALPPPEGSQPRRPSGAQNIPQSAEATGASTRTSAPTGGKRLLINVFASLTAELAENPNDAAAIRARYQMSEAAHLEESRRWTEDFTRDPVLRDRYLSIVRRYRGYLQGSAKK